MKKSKIFGIVAALAGLVQASSAGATAINYNGALFDLLITGSSGTTYNFRYTADFTSSAWQTYRSGAGTLYVDAVGFGISGYDALSVALNGTNAPGAWSGGEGTMNSSGCVLALNGQGPCANVAPITSAVTLGTYYWDFSATFRPNGPPCGRAGQPVCVATSVPDSVFLQATNQMRADFYTNGVMSLAGPFTICRDGDCSEHRVPESGSLALLGLGLIGLAAVRRGRLSSDSAEPSRR